MKDINVNNVPMLFSGENDNAVLFMSVKRLDAEQHSAPCTSMYKHTRGSQSMHIYAELTAVVSRKVF